MLLLWVFSFVLGVCVDLFYVLWIKAVSNNNIMKAVFWSVAISVCSMAGFLNAVDKRWLSVPYIIGLGTGTYIGMVVGKKKNENLD